MDDLKISEYIKEKYLQINNEIYEIIEKHRKKNFVCQHCLLALEKGCGDLPIPMLSYGEIELDELSTCTVINTYKIKHIENKIEIIKIKALGIKNLEFKNEDGTIYDLKEEIRKANERNEIKNVYER